MKGYEICSHNVQCFMIISPKLIGFPCLQDTVCVYGEGGKVYIHDIENNTLLLTLDTETTRFVLGYASLGPVVQS